MKLRVITWNVAAGEYGTDDDVVGALRAANGDIVLLNEVKQPVVGNGLVGRISEALGLNNHFEPTTTMGLFQSKGMAIFSKFPLSNFSYSGTSSVPVIRVGGYGVMSADTDIEGRPYRIINTRWDAYHVNVMEDVMRRCLVMINSTPSSFGILFGGDLNSGAEMPNDPQGSEKSRIFMEFHQSGGLISLASVSGNPDYTKGGPDYIYGRGTLSLVAATQVDHPEVSDHYLVIADLQDVVVPSVIGLPRSEAEQVLRDAGLVPEFTGSGIRVGRQSPSGGQLVKPGTSVALELVGSGGVAVPHVRELLRGQAEQEIRAAGLVPKITGSGTWVGSQTPSGGSFVSLGSTVTLQLRSGLIP